MKKIFLFAISFLLLVGSVFAGGNLNIVSDTDTEYYDAGSVSWKPAVLAWVYPGWTSGSIIDNPAAKWIWSSYMVSYDEAVIGSQAEFQRTFEIPATADSISGSIDITADTRYTLYVNGQLIGSDADWPVAENYDITAALIRGTNSISITAENYGAERADPESNPAGLLYSANIRYECPDVPEFGIVGGILATSAAGAFVLSRKRR